MITLDENSLNLSSNGYPPPHPTATGWAWIGDRPLNPNRGTGNWDQNRDGNISRSSQTVSANTDPIGNTPIGNRVLIEFPSPSPITVQSGRTTHRPRYPRAVGCKHERHPLNGNVEWSFVEWAVPTWREEYLEEASQNVISMLSSYPQKENAGKSKRIKL